MVQSGTARYVYGAAACRAAIQLLEAWRVSDTRIAFDAVGRETVDVGDGVGRHLLRTPTCDSNADEERQARNEADFERDPSSAARRCGRRRPV